MKSKKTRAGQRGNALIEAALTLSLFLTMLFSLYDFGWILFFHQTLVHQARTGARYAAVNPGSSGPGRFKLPVAVGELTVSGNSVSARIVELKVHNAA